MGTFRFVLLVLVGTLLAGSVMGQTIVPRGVAVKGIISEIDLDNRAITLNAPVLSSTDPAPARLTFYFTEATRFYKNGVPAGADALAVGDACLAECIRSETGSLVALSVKAVTPRTEFVKGKIGKINYELRLFELLVGDPNTSTFRVFMFAANEETKIFKNGAPAKFGALRSGDLASVGFLAPVLDPTKPRLATVIEARTPPELLGRVVGRVVELDFEKRIIGVLPAERLIISADPVVRLFVPENAKIDKFGESGLRALMLEDRVDVTFLKETDSVLAPVVSIVVKPNIAKGIIDGVDLEHRVIGLKATPLSPTVLFKVLDRTKIVKDGIPAELGALLKGDLAQVAYFRFPGGNVASIIAARTPLAPAP